MSKCFVPNHLHLLVKGYMKNPPKSTDELNSFFNKLVLTVRMKVVAGPTSVYVDEPGNEGVTGTVTLATSHSSMHVWDSSEPALFHFDLYSCTEFTSKEVIDLINTEFNLVSHSYWFVDRNGDNFTLKENN